MGWKKINKHRVIKLLTRDAPKQALKELLKNKQLLINSERPAKISACSNQLLKVFNQIKKQGIQPLFIGSGVADTQDLRKTRINLSFAEELTDYEVPKAVINNKAEQLFLYGRDVWSKSVIKVTEGVKRGDLVFILNEQGLFLGLAFAKSKHLLNRANKTVLQNVLDKGYYLRVED